MYDRIPVDPSDASVTWLAQIVWYGTLGTVGHFVLTLKFLGDEVIHIFDSLHQATEPPSQIRICKPIHPPSANTVCLLNELYNLYGDSSAVYQMCPHQTDNYVCGLFALACLKLAIQHRRGCLALLRTITFEKTAIYEWIGAVHTSAGWTLPIATAFVAPSSLPPFKTFVKAALPVGSDHQSDVDEDLPIRKTRSKRKIPTLDDSESDSN
jgi:hypothetical protein